MLEVFERLKYKMEPQEIHAFNIRIMSLNSNIVYWTERLSYESKAEQQEAQTELNRCNILLTIVAKDLKKVEAKLTKGE